METPWTTWWAKRWLSEELWVWILRTRKRERERDTEGAEGERDREKVKTLPEQTLNETRS